MPAGYRLCILWMFVITVLVIKCGNAELTPPYFNLATGRKIYSTATCGVDSDGPELYCKLVGANTEHDNQYFSVIQGQVCDVCDPTRNDKSHPPEYAIDGKETWWQSPPLSRGMKYNEVNLTIDFGQEFHVAYLYIRMGNSPRPGLWTLEKSSDYGQTWSPWQHFSDTTADCETYFGKKSLKPITNDDDIICTTEYSKIVPLENGEIPIMLLNNRPSANNYFNSSVLQEWTRATNIRIRLLRTKNLLGHLMSVVSKDPSVTRRYFYSIKDISIGGRCMCNGHADTCDVLDPRSHRRLLACRCQHRTCGIQCNECCPGFEQKKWRQNTNARPFQCEPCNCFGHSDHCIYDEEIDRLGLSLDIYNKYEGGGVCQNCRHNTEGINCNKCKEKYFRPYGKHWNETNVCTPCNCDFFYSTGNCEEETGRCECRVEYHAPNCDSCAYGYFGYPNCRECECNLNGTVGYHCATTDGKCPCKPNFAGHFCKECSPGYYGYPDCKSCECNEIGSASSNCNSIDGNCTCLGNFGGEKCDRCKHGYYLYPSCLYCDCDIKGTQTEVCDKANGKCLCREGYGGQRCDQCLPGYYNYPNCTPCNCSILGSTSTTCDNTGRCLCLSNFAGKQCTSCSTGFYSYPDCLPCGCDVHGSEGISCNSEGHCSCFDNFDGSKCNACKEGFYNFPACEECNCDPAGVIAKFAGCGSVPEGELCQCKERVSGRICNQCKPLYWNLNISNVDGCEVCDCFLDGTIGSLDTCDPNTGQCFCKPTVGNRQCRECVDGTFDLFGGSLFGCKDCFCDIGGSRNLNCDKSTGQCNCHPRVAGRTCSHPLTTHFFPTLYQFQFEYENGYTPAGTFVRYQFDESQFPKFSGKGYAVFSTIQNEVINEINIFKSSVYRVVIRYINPSHENVTASILITSDNPSELDQSTKVLFKPTSIPTFVTVSGLKAATPSAIVLDPGRYTFSITTDKHILLDYFVLLPAAYYEASILSRKVENPCEIGSLELCRHYSYPPLNEFNPSFYGSVKEKNSFIPPLEVYEDLEHLSIIDQIPNAPTISNLQNSLYYNVSVPRQGQYIIVVDYITDRAKPETYILQVQKDTDPNYGFITMYPCLYTMACRQPVIDSESREKIFNVDPAKRLLLQVYHEHEDFGRVAIISVTAIPVEIWSTDFIEPKPVCIIKDGERIHASYRSVPDSKKVEFGNTVSAKEVPPNIFDEKAVLIGLNQDNSTLSLRSKVLHPGQFLILVKYYQPNYPQYDLLYKLETKKMLYEGKFHVSFCPSNIGCRALIAPSNNNTFEIDDEFRLSLTNTRPKNFWIEYMLVVPAEEYDNNLLQEEKFDQTKEFIKKCGQDHFHIQLNASEFCRKTVFSLTANYNDGALPCNCDYDGSTSFECDPFGGQCPCKPNVIGRQCDSCKTGYYGFPDCKHCDCPLTALCEKDTGECICPPNVIGEKCDKCEPYTYGFHQIIGCEQCKCHPLGVEDGNLQCDLLNGSCICGAHIEGRTCDECSNGFFGFPDCKSCKCNIAGTTFKVCDKRDESCFCKENVIGSHCEYCAEGTYNLQQSNPEGCTKCFCFGKTNRCESAYLRVFNVSILKNITVNTVNIENGDIEIEQWKIPLEEIVLNDTSLQVDFSYGLNRGGLVYVGMLHYLGSQNNHLTSYGGVLEYTLYYTTGPFGSALYGPDIILHSENCILIHQSYSQPANAQIFNGKVILIETNFQTIDNRPVPREQFMMALRNLNTIYIRASYWEETIITQISDVFLSMADEDEEKIYYQQLPVEKCYCPPGYSGLSCEDCAPGYYRDPNGPFGGYCIPCQCNGHSSACDCHTGICEECTHFTTGDHCEKCVTGYHGNATLGTPFDCMICACPLPYESNNFATSCEISDSGIEIHCHCLEGYFGPRCESCASGYYGQPEKIGSSCQRCDCSGNINPDEPGSCDTVTGDCLKCLNNTHGKACNLCAPGYYGDAIKLKDCRSCDCEFLGTKYCDSFIGTCNCHDNVIGNRCDSCDDNFYGYDSGMGCKPCNCAVASQNSQCDLHSGDCICMPGVSGRQCDRCSADHWNYTANGCVPCSCNKGFSRGFGCNPESGHCECLPGVIGEKCDACPHRWLFVKDIGCSECDACIHALLDFIDSTDARIDPLVKDFHTVALSYFTSQKLSYFNKLSDIIEPKVKSLNPRSINLAPLKREVESLHADSKLLNQLTGVASNNSKDLFLNGGKLRKNAKDILDESQLIAIKTFDTIKEVENFENSFDTTTSTKAENALTEVKIIFGELTKDNENSNVQHDPSQLENSRNLVSDTEFTMLPIKWQNDTVFGLKKDIDSFNEKLSDLKEWSNASNVRTNAILNLTERNRENFKNSKFEVVSNQTFDVENDVAKSIILFQNTDLTIDAINKNLVVLKDGLEELKDGNKKVDELLPRTEDDYNSIHNAMEEGEMHIAEVIGLANKITGRYSNITSNSEQAIKAATVYSDILKGILDAQKIQRDAKYAAANATEKSKGVRDRANQSRVSGQKLLQNAKTSLKIVSETLGPHLNKSSDAVSKTLGFNNAKEDQLKAMNLALESLPRQNSVNEWDIANEKATKTLGSSKMAVEMLLPINSFIPGNLMLAQQLPKDIDTSSKEISQTENHLDKVEALGPRLSALVGKMDKKQAQINLIGSDISDRLNRLKKKIEMARNLANGIDVGVTFHPNTVLELKNPDNLSRLATNFNISFYFNTTKPNGFLFYLGNENKNNEKTDKSQDFVAVEVENGYPVLTVDLGSGPEKFISKKNVADGEWYQAIITRTMDQVKLTIKEETADGNEEAHVTEHLLSNKFLLFDVDENSKLFAGGYSADFTAPEDLRYSSFDGQIEKLKIQDEYIGLWNFVDGGENMEGALRRNRLLSQEMPPTGYRFSGNGYVVLDTKPHHFKTRSTIHFRFKCSTDSSDGLLFYTGQGDHYLSVELVQGAIYFKYKLGEHKVVIGSNSTLNDNLWHRVEAERDGYKGVLKIDGKDVYQEELLPGSPINLMVSDQMYFGGIFENVHPDIQSNGFDGCIDDVVISGTPVDLSQNVKAYGVRPGCPEKFSASVSFKPGGYGYLSYGNVSINNGVFLSFKFLTKKDEGILFYAGNNHAADGIGLYLINGNIVLRCMEIEFSTNSKNYSDGQWHFVNVKYDDDGLILYVDNVVKYRSLSSLNALFIQSGRMFIGGLSQSDVALKGVHPTLENFIGCISDFTLNGNILNFASTVDRTGADLDMCLESLNDTGSSFAIPREDVHMRNVTYDFGDNVYENIDEKKTWADNVTSSYSDADNVEKFTPEFDPPVSPKKPMRTRPHFVSKGDSECMLPWNPSLEEIDVVKAGFRFGTAANSRMEIKQIPNKVRKGFDVSLEFKTTSYEGLLFYAADANHTDFVALYLKGGKVHYTFHIAQKSINMSSAYHYNDNKWHEVTITRSHLKGQLILGNDDITQGELPINSKGLINYQSPFYVGDVDPQLSDDLNLNLQLEKGTLYEGCIRALKIQNRLVPNASFHPKGVIPCSEEVEKGIYFTKGYVKLRDKFNVGAEFTVSFDIKPRVTTGMLLSVHGKNAYLILQMLNGTINFTVDNGEGPIVATFKPNPGENLCDGHWRTVEAIKSQYVITLIVNAVSSQPAIGSASHPLTETTRPLFMGGHPHIMKVRGLTARKPFVGCIRNLKIKGQPEKIGNHMTFGDVQTGVCPTN